MPQLIAEAGRAPPAEARLALSAADQALSQPVSPRRLTEAVNVLGMMLKWPGEGVIVDRKVFLTGLDQAIRDRKYAEPVVNEAMRRLRDSEKWTPAISEVLEVCEAVSEEWSQAIFARERDMCEQEAREAREAYERECERDPGRRWRDMIAGLEREAQELRRRREKLEALPLRQREKLEADIREIEDEEWRVATDLEEARRELDACDGPADDDRR